MSNHDIPTPSDDVAANAGPRTPPPIDPALFAEMVDQRERTMTAIRRVRDAFGPPGDWGYDSPKGYALCKLFDIFNELHHAAKVTPS